MKNKRRPFGNRSGLPREESPDRDRHGLREMREGEPNTLRLFRWQGTKSLSTSLVNTCCGCGLRHLLVFEVFRGRGGHFYLNKRAYLPDAGRKRKR